MKEIQFNQTPMPERPVDERVKDFTEVALGYTPELEEKEA